MQESSINSIELRHYQHQAIENILSALRQGARTALVQAPCGAGKSIIMASFVARVLAKNRDWSCLVLVPKVKLVDQLTEALTKLVGRPAVCCGTRGKREVGQITVATYQSIGLITNPTAFDAIILDEAHQFDPKDDSNQHQLLKSFSHAGTKVVGFTATPWRGSKPIWLLSDFWSEPCYTIDINTLTTEGHLIRARMVRGAEEHSTKGFKVSMGDWAADDLSALSCDTDKLKRQVADAMSHLDIHNRQSVIWMCIDQAHATSLHEYLVGIGEKSCLIISNLSQSERDEGFEEFSAGSVRHLVSVAIATEGFDEPRADALVFLRPTRSVVAYIQSVGRVLRPSPLTGKGQGSYALVLDYGQVVKNCGAIDRPLIDVAGEHRQDSTASRKKIAEDLGYIVIPCEKCGAFFFPAKQEERICPECGHNNDDAKTKKLREKAASGELYASDVIDHEFARFFVVGVEITNDVETSLCLITFHTKASMFGSQVSGKTRFELFRRMDFVPQDKRTIIFAANAKRFLKKYFGIDGGTLNERYGVLDSGSAPFMPKEIVQTEKGDYKINGTQKFAWRVDAQDVMQETLL